MKLVILVVMYFRMCLVILVMLFSSSFKACCNLSTFSIFFQSYSLGDNEVLVSGAKGNPPTADYKVL